MRIDRLMALGCLLALFLSLCAASQAPAQVVMARAASSVSFGAGGADGLTSEDVNELKRILRLNEHQEMLLSDLFEAYQADANAAIAEMSRIEAAAMEEFERSNNDFSIFAAVGTKRHLFERYIDKLKERMFDDIKLVLSEEQIERFTLFERYYRRSRQLTAYPNPVRGGSVDVIAMIRKVSMPIESREAIEPVLERYAAEIDRFLQSNNAEEITRRFTSDGDRMGIEDGTIGQEQLSAILARTGEMLKEFRRVSEAIREINQRTIRQIATVVPEEVAAQIDRQFLKESFPEVYVDTEGFGVLRTVEQFTDLTPDQRAKIDEMKAAFYRDAERLNGLWAKAIEAEEAKVAEAAGGMVFVFASEEGSRKARTERQALDTKLIEQIKAVLTPSQAQRLPGSDIIDWRSMGNWE